MKRIVLALCLTLAACTGSFEQGVPTLLVLGYGGEDGRLALVQEVRAPGGGNVEFLLLDTVDEVPGRILAHDVVNRNDSASGENERSQLVVLSQADTDELFVSIFAFANIVFDGESAALELERDIINLNTATEQTFEIGTDPDDEVIIQVSNNGRYIALLTEADNETQSRLDVVDLEADRNDEVELLNQEDDVENGVLFLDQAAQRLYFLREEAAGQELIFLDLNDRSTPTDIFEVIDENYAIPGSIRLNQKVRDLGRLGSSLLALQGDSFRFIGTALPFQAGEPFESIDNAESFIPLNSTQDLPLFIYSDDELGVYRELNDEVDVADNPITVLDASVQFDEGFIYFLRDSTPPLAVFDLRRYLRDTNDELDANDLFSFRIENADGEAVELAEPVFVEWTRAVIATE